MKIHRWVRIKTVNKNNSHNIREDTLNRRFCRDVKGAALLPCMHKYARLVPSGRVVELVDTPALGAGAARREGSSPFSPTKKTFSLESVFLFLM